MGEELDLGMAELNVIAKNLGHVTTNFWQMSLYEVYAIHNSSVAEMKVREGALIKQTKVANRLLRN